MMGNSLDYIIKRYSHHTDQYPVNNWLNDIFGCRIILTRSTIEAIEEQLDTWHEKYNLKNWYKRNKDGYKGIYVYFKNRNNFHFPWELQIWDENHVESNIKAHQNFLYRSCSCMLQDYCQ